MTTKKPANKTTNRHSGDDIKIAKAYLSKANSSKDRGIEFNIPFVSFKNMLRAKKCYFTGLTLTADTFTIDRIDSNKPYEAGNVAACHTIFNSLKSMIENPANELDLTKALKGLQRTAKRIKRSK